MQRVTLHTWFHIKITYYRITALITAFYQCLWEVEIKIACDRITALITALYQCVWEVEIKITYDRITALITALYQCLWEVEIKIAYDRITAHYCLVSVFVRSRDLSRYDSTGHWQIWFNKNNVDTEVHIRYWKPSQNETFALQMFCIQWISQMYMT